MGKFCFHCANTKYRFYLHFSVQLYFLCQLYLVSQYMALNLHQASIIYRKTFKYRSASLNNCIVEIGLRRLITNKNQSLYTNDYVCIHFVTCYLTWKCCKRLYIFLQAWILHWDRSFLCWKISCINAALKKMLMLMLIKFRAYLAESEKCSCSAHGALSVLQISANLKAGTKPIVSTGSSFAEQ